MRIKWMPSNWRNRKTKSIVFVLMACLLACTGCGPKAEVSSNSLRTVTLQTNWAPQPEDGGFFHAAQSGLYRDEGLEVSVHPASAGMNIYSYIAAGEAEFGISVLAKLVVAIDRGLPLVAIASYRPASLRVLLLREEDPAIDFPDLDQRMIKARGEDLWLKYLQHEYDLELRVVPHDFGLGQFLARQDLIQQGLLTSEPFTLKEKGVPVRTLELSKAGWENMEVIFCRRELLESNPELAKSVARASLLGWQRFLQEDAEETLKWLAQENPARSIDSMRWAREALARMYAESGVFENGEFGVVDSAKVERMIKILAELGAIDEAMPVEDVVDFSIMRNP